MEPASKFVYADYCQYQQAGTAPSTAAAPAEEMSEPIEDNDHMYTYVAMREPDVTKDAQVCNMENANKNEHITYPSSSPLHMLITRSTLTLINRIRPIRV